MLQGNGPDPRFHEGAQDERHGGGVALAPPAVVVDASVAVKWYVDEELSDEAIALRRQWAASGTRILVPDFLRLEFTNAISFQKNITPAEKRRMVHNLLETTFDTLITDPDMIKDALELALKLNASVYDCLYLAFALYYKATLVTADARFAAKAKGHPVKVLGG
jgi:predicted nucleic acid-binding protein